MRHALSRATVPAKTMRFPSHETQGSLASNSVAAGSNSRNRPSLPRTNSCPPVASVRWRGPKPGTAPGVAPSARLRETKTSGGSRGADCAATSDSSGTMSRRRRAYLMFGAGRGRRAPLSHQGNPALQRSAARREDGAVDACGLDPAPVVAAVPDPRVCPRPLRGRTGKAAHDAAAEIEDGERDLRRLEQGVREVDRAGGRRGEGRSEERSDGASMRHGDRARAHDAPDRAAARACAGCALPAVPERAVGSDGVVAYELHAGRPV